MNLSDSITFWIGKGLASLIPLAIIASVAAVIFGAAWTYDEAVRVARKARALVASGGSHHRAWWQAAGPVPFIIVALALTVLAIGLALRGSP